MKVSVEMEVWEEMAEDAEGSEMCHCDGDRGECGDVGR